MPDEYVVGPSANVEGIGRLLQIAFDYPRLSVPVGDPTRIAELLAVGLWCFAGTFDHVERYHCHQGATARFV